MQSTTTAEADRTPEIAPAIRHLVPWRVVSATVMPGLRLYVTFVDATKGEVHLAEFLRSSHVDGTIFEPLRDPGAFKEVRIVMGAVQWPNGAELSPDSMYDAISRHGTWVVT